MPPATLSDWLDSTVEQRRQLYRATKRIVDAGFLTWRDLYRDALDRPGGFGKGYEDNFRSGRISRKNAARIARFLVERLSRPDLPIPAEFAPELLNADRLDDWDRLVGRASRDGLFFSVERDRRFTHTTTLSPGEHVSIRLDAPDHGRVFGLFGHESGTWRALPLHILPAKLSGGAARFVFIEDDFDRGERGASPPNPEKGFHDVGPLTVVVVYVEDSAPDYTASWKAFRPVPRIQLDRMAIHLALTQPTSLVRRADLEIVSPLGPTG